VAAEDPPPTAEKPKPEPSPGGTEPDAGTGTFVSRLLAYTRAEKPQEKIPGEPPADESAESDH
jgi:hypothetical protein